MRTGKLLENYRRSYEKMRRTEGIYIGEKILYHYPNQRRNKIYADYNHIGIIRDLKYASATVNLADERTI